MVAAVNHAPLLTPAGCASKLNGGGGTKLFGKLFSFKEFVVVLNYLSN